MTNSFKHLSKTMAHALRHAPEKYGLVPDRDGWIKLSDLITGLQTVSDRWATLDQHMIETMLEASEKKRFEVDGNKVRAIYGHSSDKIDISYERTEPPEILYHGTTKNAAQSIQQGGLNSQQRKFVHLSPDVETALAVARRRTQTPVLIKVLALEAFQDGVNFYCGHNTVWLSDNIGAKFLRFD